MTLCNTIVLGIFIAVLLILNSKYAKTDDEKFQLEQKYQKERAHFDSELSAKNATIANLEQKIAYLDNQLTTIPARARWLSDWEHKIEERERNVTQREQALHKNNEELIARRVDEKYTEYTKNKDKEYAYNWQIIKRKTRVLAEREQKMYKRAVLIANYLGIPLKRILLRSEKKLVDELASDLIEERQALIDLVMSCPDDQTKALLSAMQQFLGNWKR